MQKENLKTFINKYSLNGIVESVKWVYTKDEKALTTSAITEEKNVLISVKEKNNQNFDEDCQLGIFDTQKLVKMISVLDQEIDLTLNKKDKIITSITFSDKNTDVQFITADLSVIPVAPNLKKLPEFELEIPLTDQFINTFVKAKNALSEVDTFTFLKNKKKKIEAVIGHSNLNTNKISISVDTVDGKGELEREISFNAKYFKEILTANSDCKDSILKISSSGLAMVEFSNDLFESKYYMVEIKMA